MMFCLNCFKRDNPGIEPWLLRAGVGSLGAKGGLVKAVPRIEAWAQLMRSTQSILTIES